MIRSRYNQIAHPAPDTRRERNAYNKDSIKFIKAQVESQEDSSFPADCHQAILNKMNKKSKMNRKQTNIDSKKTAIKFYVKTLNK